MNWISLSIKYQEGKLELLDQTRLPQEEIWLEIADLASMVEAIKLLKVRGAPAIGLAAALYLDKSLHEGTSFEKLREEAKTLIDSRPTAVNLSHYLEQLVLSKESIDSHSFSDEVLLLVEKDRQMCEAMAEHGAALVSDGDRLLTHCNTGGLATAGIGTAFGVLLKSHQQKKIHVYVDETRPLLQGGRLTAWECDKFGISHELICDNMAGFLMAQKRVDKIFVGADRICANGDFANKIGTYSLSVLAKAHGIPFYVVAPSTTIDKNCADGSEIPIENRNPDEVRGFVHPRGNTLWAPPFSSVYNPAFDITPFENVSGIITEDGVFTNPPKNF